MSIANQHIKYQQIKKKTLPIKNQRIFNFKVEFFN